MQPLSVGGYARLREALGVVALNELVVLVCRIAFFIVTIFYDCKDNHIHPKNETRH